VHFVGVLFRHFRALHRSSNNNFIKTPAGYTDVAGGSSRRRRRNRNENTIIIYFVHTRPVRPPRVLSRRVPPKAEADRTSAASLG